MTNYVIETLRVASDFTTLSLLIWRRFGRPMPGLVEDTLTRNQGLADVGSFLPVGTEIAVKIETTPQNADQQLDTIRLW